MLMKIFAAGSAISAIGLALHALLAQSGTAQAVEFAGAGFLVAICWAFWSHIKESTKRHDEQQAAFRQELTELRREERNARDEAMERQIKQFGTLMENAITRRCEECPGRQAGEPDNDG